MTDNEIIKALNDADGLNHVSLYCADNKGKNATPVKVSDIVNLINRQKAEIEKLQSDQYAIDKFARDLCKERMLKGKAIADFEDLQDYIKKEKNEAIREFAERLKKIYAAHDGLSIIIDNLVKEMTEGENV